MVRPWYCSRNKSLERLYEYHGHGMKLELENGTTVKNPDAAAIGKSLALVQGFAILSKDRMTYIQAVGSAKDGFLLEYQEGDTDQHYRCPEILPLEQATRAFVSYAQVDDGWRTSISWRGGTGSAGEAEGPLPRSMRRHLGLKTLFEFAGGIGAPALWILYHFFYVGDFPSGVRGGIEFIGLFIAGILVPHTIFKHLIGARCPAAGCHGKTFPEGTNPITYVCRSCKRSYDSGMSEGGDT